MKRSSIAPMPEYFDRYINLVENTTIAEAFENSLKRLDEYDHYKLSQLNEKVYASGKWTAKEILQHIIDIERILSYRTLRFARADNTALPGFDEELLAKNSNAGNRTVRDLIEEMKIVRRSTQAMFRSFDEDSLFRKGINWKYEISVLAMGFVILGHEIHHMKIIEEKYYPLLNANGVIQ